MTNRNPPALAGGGCQVWVFPRTAIIRHQLLSQMLDKFSERLKAAVKEEEGVDDDDQGEYYTTPHLTFPLLHFWR